ncbi:14509_t:CDS:2, partial [Gigaspora rosea]
IQNNTRPVIDQGMVNTNQEISWMVNTLIKEPIGAGLENFENLGKLGEFAKIRGVLPIVGV